MGSENACALDFACILERNIKCSVINSNIGGEIKIQSGPSLALTPSVAIFMSYYFATKGRGLWTGD